MAIFLTEENVKFLCAMKDAIPVLEEAFAEKGSSSAINVPRFRPTINGVGLTMMVSALGGKRVSGFKVMGAGKPMVLIFGADSSDVVSENMHSGAMKRLERGRELLAVLEASSLGQIRTGAATGLATKYMSAVQSKTVGIVGTGFQARSQLEAVCIVRDIEKIKAYSRNVDRKKSFCEEMSQLLSIDVVPADSAEEAVSDTDIVVAVTNVRTLDPVVFGDWIKPGSHINAAGANSLERRELDDTAVTLSSVIAVDDIVQAKLECADLVLPIQSGILDWDKVIELGELVISDSEIRSNLNSDAVTLFESQGIGLEDIAVATYIYEEAVRMGVGLDLPF